MAGRSAWGRITLWDAACDNNVEKCRQKVEQSKVNVNERDSNGKTAILEASRWNAIDAMNYLLSVGADITISNNDGQTCVHVSSEQSSLEALNLLLDKKANIDARDINMDTPLMVAAGKGRIEAVKLLLSRGADKTLKNANGKTALDLCANPDIAAVLRGETYQSATHY